MQPYLLGRRSILFVLCRLAVFAILAKFGQASAQSRVMKINLFRFCNAAVLGAALIIPVTLAPLSLRAETAKSYHDKQHNDDHQWNSNEDRAYQMYAKENHRKYTTFAKLNDNDQQAYWGWRHDHSDAMLEDQYSAKTALERAPWRAARGGRDLRPLGSGC